jgi:hypothetical protein
MKHLIALSFLLAIGLNLLKAQGALYQVNNSVGPTNGKSRFSENTIKPYFPLKEAASQPLPPKNYHNKSGLSLNIVDYFSSALTLSYEYYTKNGNYSLKVPISIGVNTYGKHAPKIHETAYRTRQAYYRENKKFSTGLESYYYPFGQGNARYYLGAALEYGQFEFIGIVPSIGFIDYKEKDQIGTFKTILFQQGVLFQPSTRINFNLGIGLGYCQTRFKQEDAFGAQIEPYNRSEFAARFIFTVGYRFNGILKDKTLR